MKISLGNVADIHLMKKPERFGFLLFFPALTMQID